jgi:hypothetical protein
MGNPTPMPFGAGIIRNRKAESRAGAMVLAAVRSWFDRQKIKIFPT